MLRASHHFDAFAHLIASVLAQAMACRSQIPGAAPTTTMQFPPRSLDTLRRHVHKMCFNSGPKQNSVHHCGRAIDACGTLWPETNATTGSHVQLLAASSKSQTQKCNSCVKRNKWFPTGPMLNSLEHASKKLKGVANGTAISDHETWRHQRRSMISKATHLVHSRSDTDIPLLNVCPFCTPECRNVDRPQWPRFECVATPITPRACDRT